MKNSALKTIAFWTFMVVLMMAVLTNFDKTAKAKVQKPSYNEFLGMVAGGEVEEVTVAPKKEGQGFQVEGRLKTEGQDGQAVHFSLLAPPGDTAFFSDLRSSGVKVNVEEPTISIGQILLNVLMASWPILLLIFLWMFLLNRMQGGGPGGAMQFGKSRAKMLQGNERKVTFKDVAGVDEAKEELGEVVEFLKDPARFQRLGGKIPKGVLLLGPPGTGKTLMARAVAGEAGRPFFSISGSDFVEMFVGVGASRVRDLFEQGKKHAPCIIFIDEIDAVGRHRGAGLGGGHDEREQTLNALLVEMDGFETNSGVILVAATNRPDVLDPALTRPGRFDRQVVVDRPDLTGREGILKVHSKEIVLGAEVDLKVLARRTPGFSGADLANLMNEGALLAARRDKKAVGMDELEEAIDRVMAGPQRKSRVMSDDEKRVIAYHESGHALVAHLTKKTDPVHMISIIPRGAGILGYVMQLPTEDRFTKQRQEILADLDVMLGGRCAEELIFKDISTGASNDLERATGTARRMVTEFGMSAKLGHATYGQRDREIFLGRDITSDRNYSDKTAQVIDEETRKIVESAHTRAKAILSKNKKMLVKLAETLLEKETVEGSQLDALLGIKRPAKKGKTSGSPSSPAGGEAGGQERKEKDKGKSPVAPSPSPAPA
jgi:cell division protease FtsH